jgi:ParB/RepB/Spo0J family partition protein
MRSEALASDQDIFKNARLFQVSKIFADPFFNCRGEIRPIDVVDLAQNISEKGLLAPITIQPKLPTTPQQYDFVCVCGHRRLKAYQVIGAAEIPAILRTGLSEFEARTMNNVENLKRKDLNVMQEAKCVEPYRRAGWTREEIAHELKVSPGWVQIRLCALDLEPELQEGVAAGLFSQPQIRELHAIKNTDQRFKAAKMIKEAKERHDKKAANQVQIKPTKATQKRQRKKHEADQIMEILLRLFGGCLATRTIAWLFGEISDIEYHTDIQKYAKAINKEYKIPEFEEI